MSLKQNLSLKLGQGVVMTPQLQQAIKLLQLPSTELAAFINQELLENPFLSPDDGTSEVDASEFEPLESAQADSASLMERGAALTDDTPPLDYAWDNVYDTARPTHTASSSWKGDEEPDFESVATREGSLKDHLEAQLGVAARDVPTRIIGKYLIDAIDDAGYLRIDTTEVIKKLSITPSRLEQVIALLHTFDPAGVGARSLSECLRLQLAAQSPLTPVVRLVVENLDLVARRDVEKLVKLTESTPETVQKILARIATLNPKPGLKFGGDNASSVIPELIVHSKDGHWQVDLNADAMPKLLLSRGAENINPANGAKAYTTERLGRAKWLLASLEQRARTILKVGRALINAQSDFLTYGVEAIKPLTLKQIADIVGVHESTVSRVTSGKFIQTPIGVFELKYFFSAGLGTTGGNEGVAAMSVKEMIKRHIDGEDASKPLSDEVIVKKIKNEGVDVARRTVAKYREQLGIGSSSERRIKG